MYKPLKRIEYIGYVVVRLFSLFLSLQELVRNGCPINILDYWYHIPPSNGTQGHIAEFHPISTRSCAATWSERYIASRLSTQFHPKFYNQMIFRPLQH